MLVLGQQRFCRRRCRSKNDEITGGSLGIWAGVVIAAIATTKMVDGNALANPYVAYRTSPLDQSSVTTSSEWSKTPSEIHKRSITRIAHERKVVSTSEPESSDEKSKTGGSDERTEQCEKLEFRVGLSHRAAATTTTSDEDEDEQSGEARSTHSPAISYPIHPDIGERQVLFTTDVEHLDIVSSSAQGKDGTPISAEAQFPLFFYGANFFYSHPLIHDVNGDGIPEAILADYNGALFLVGLEAPSKDDGRYFRYGKVPHLFVRSNWYKSVVNATIEPNRYGHYDDVLHTYFEYTSEWQTQQDAKNRSPRTADVLHQSVDTRNAVVEKRREQRRRLYLLEERRQNERQRMADGEQSPPTEGAAQTTTEAYETASSRRRLQEEAGTERDIQEDDGTWELDHHEDHEEELVDAAEHEDLREDWWDVDDADDWAPQEEMDTIEGEMYDDYQHEEEENGEIEDKEHEYYGDDAAYGAMDDYIGPTGDDIYAYGDDYMGFDRPAAHDDEAPAEITKNLRLPPHILSTPAILEIKKGETTQSVEEYLVIAASYYFDEDEGQTDTSAEEFLSTEEDRGLYVASAILLYDMKDKRWTGQQNLELSTDYSAPTNHTAVGGTAPIGTDNFNQMGAFVLSSPTVADIDGDGKQEIIVGTCMGIVHILEAPTGVRKEAALSVQMKFPIHRRIIVEDVVTPSEGGKSGGLEMFVLDEGGNVLCINAGMKAPVWHRDLLEGESDATVVATSGMVLGDVDGDGALDLVLALRVMNSDKEVEIRIYAMIAATGSDIPFFPMAISDESKREAQSLPQPLLVNLHATQWSRNKRQERPRGGDGNESDEQSLSIVQPVHSKLLVINGGTGCWQTVDVGEEVAAPVQADDVHGANALDLVVTTVWGHILTVEVGRRSGTGTGVISDVEHHAGNAWHFGDVRSRMGGHAGSSTHGLSAPCGISVHPAHRQYREILGLHVPLTFEIFDVRPISGDRRYELEVRAGTSPSRAFHHASFDKVGTFTEHMPGLARFGPGYYTLTVRLTTFPNGAVYEDEFHIAYNVSYASGFFQWIVLIPLIVATIPLLCYQRKLNWEEDDDYGSRRGGILGRA